MTFAAKRYGIIAGNGLLPLTLAQRLSETGFQPHVIGVEGEADPALGQYHYQSLALEKIAYSVPYLKSKGVTHVVFAGGVRRRPKVSSLRVPLLLWPDLPAVASALKRGDDGLLVALIKLFERHGLIMLGAHSILPDHVTPFGVVTGVKPAAKHHATLSRGVEAAKLIGKLDIGQAVVALGKRVIAVEGIEGTDQMLSRVAQLREQGRLDVKAAPILIKIAKPGQELRADMPVIGVTTIAGCKAAGIALICVSAGTTLIMDVARTLEAAQLAGISVFGINPDDWLKDP